MYYRARCSIGQGGDLPSKQLDAVGITAAAAKANLRAKIVIFRGDREIAPTVPSNAILESGVTISDFSETWLDSLKPTKSKENSLEGREVSSGAFTLYRRIAGIIADDEIGALYFATVKPIELREFLNERIAWFNEEKSLWERWSYVKTAHMILRMSDIARDCRHCSGIIRGHHGRPCGVFARLGQ